MSRSVARDLAQNPLHPDAGSSPVFVKTKRGIAWESQGSADGVLVYSSKRLPFSDLSNASGLTCLVVASGASASGTFTNYLATVNNVNAPNSGWNYKHEQYNNTGKQGFTVHGGLGNWTSIIDSPTDDKDFVGTLSWDGSSAKLDRLYFDGRVASDSTSASTGSGTEITVYAIGAERGRSTDPIRFGIDRLHPQRQDRSD